MVLTLLQFFCAAQRVIDVDKNVNLPANLFFSIGGEPVVNVKFVRLTSGSPFFKEQWMTATGTSSTNLIYKGGTAKLNLLDNTIYFLDADGNERVVTTPLKEIVLTDTVTTNTYHFIHSSFLPNAVQRTWYLQLASGRTSLYQVFQKQLFESKPYGSATTEQSIITRDLFFVLYNGQLSPVKKPKDLPAILSDKKSELTEYLKKETSKSEDIATQLATAIAYYNSLF